MSDLSLPPWSRLVYEAIEGCFYDDRLTHAILLDASPGWGVFELAEQVAKLILRQVPDFNLERHLDFLQFDVEKGRGFISIDQVRFATTFLSTTAREGERKVVTIKQADKLSIPAAQALLKVLEEPPVNKHLILVSTNSAWLPPTIRSRCQRFVMRHGTKEQVTAFLESQGLATDEFTDMLAEYGGAPYTALEAYREQRAKLKDTLEKWFRDPDQMSLTAIARQLKEEDADDLLRRWQYISLRSARKLARNRAVVEPVASFYDLLCDLRRQFREVPGLDRERQFLQLLIKWREVLPQRSRSAR